MLTIKHDNKDGTAQIEAGQQFRLKASGSEYVNNADGSLKRIGKDRSHRRKRKLAAALKTS